MDWKNPASGFQRRQELIIGGANQTEYSAVIRVLHVVESFDGQAIESWLLRLLKMDWRSYGEFEWTYYCILGRRGELEDDVRQMGGEVLHSPCGVGKPMAFISSLRRTMQAGCYDVIHCHHDIMSALPLLASVGLPIWRRIVHVHNTSIDLPTSNPFKLAVLKPIFRQICLRADRVVGVSRDALNAMLAGHELQPNRDSVIHCGIETRRFSRDETVAARLRLSFGLGNDAKILLFVGRMTAYKNPGFVIEVLEHLQHCDSRYAAVFTGTGPHEEAVKQTALQKGLHGRMRVLGWRHDIPELMHACDLLIWPGIEHPKEGLGLVVVEAQAAGLPVLMSRNVPEEAIVVPSLVEILPLSAGAKVWAQTVTKMLNKRYPDRGESRAFVEGSSFSMEHSTANIAGLYS